MIFVCFVVFTFLFVAFFGGGKLSLDFHDLFYNLNFEKEKLLLKDLFEGCLYGHENEVSKGLRG